MFKEQIEIKELLRNVGLCALSGLLMAAGLYFFIYPADFAPGGVDGIVAMLRYITHDKINSSYINLAINLPLLVAAWFLLKRRYVIYTMIYTAFFTVFLFVFEQFQLLDKLYALLNTDMPDFTDVGVRILFSIFGAALESGTGIMLRMGASSGGIDIAASIIQQKRSHINVERIIAVLAVIIVAVSFFVYKDIVSVLLSFVNIFVHERISGSILRDMRNAVKFEVVTEDFEGFKREIFYEIGHGATVLEGKGMYTDRHKHVVVCIVNYRQIAAFLKIVSRHKSAFAYYSDVMGVRGDFRWKKGEKLSEEQRLLEKRLEEEFAMTDQKEESHTETDEK